MNGQAALFEIISCRTCAETATCTLTVNGRTHPYCDGCADWHADWARGPWCSSANTSEGAWYCLLAFRGVVS